MRVSGTTNAQGLRRVLSAVETRARIIYDAKGLKSPWKSAYAPLRMECRRQAERELGN